MNNLPKQTSKPHPTARSGNTGLVRCWRSTDKVRNKNRPMGFYVEIQTELHPRSKI